MIVGFMQNVLSVILLLLILSSCSTPLAYNKFQCDKSRDSLKAEITAIVTAEGLPLTNSDEDRLSFNNGGALYFYSWDFILQPDVVLAFPRINIIKNSTTKPRTNYTTFLPAPVAFIFSIFTIKSDIKNIKKMLSTKVFDAAHDGIIQGDDTPASQTWYWNVRAKIEKLCGTKMILVKEGDK